MLFVKSDRSTLRVGIYMAAYKEEKEPQTRPAFLKDLKKVARKLEPDEQHLKKPKGRRRGSS